MERKGASYKISSSRFAPTWTDASAGARSSVSVPGGVGDVTSSANIGGGYPRYLLESVHRRQSPGAHMASVEHTTGTDRTGEPQTSVYTAGPFRTQKRSQMAAEALSNRVERGGNTSRYQN